MNGRLKYVRIIVSERIMSLMRDDRTARYLRHTVLDGIGEEGQKRLLSSRVLMIGAGGLGSICSMYLAAAGIGSLVIADYDAVDISNLPRQLLYTPADAGKNKAEAAAIKLRIINPDTYIEVFTQRVDPDNIQSLFENCDFVIDAVDRLGTKFLINDACVLAGKPFSHAGVVRYGGQAMTYVPEKGPCLRCFIPEVPENTDTCSRVGVLGPCVGVLGSVQAAECIKYLAGNENLLTGKILTFDAEKMTSRVTSLPADPSCPVCSNNAVITSLTDRTGEYYL